MKSLANHHCAHAISRSTWQHRLVLKLKPHNKIFIKKCRKKAVNPEFFGHFEPDRLGMLMTFCYVVQSKMILTMYLFLQHFFPTFFFFFGMAESLRCFHLGSTRSSATDTWLHVGVSKLFPLWQIGALHSPGAPLAPRKQRGNSITRRRLGCTSAHIWKHRRQNSVPRPSTSRRFAIDTHSRLATVQAISDEMKNEPTYFEVTTSELMKSGRSFVCLFRVHTTAN